MSISRVLTLVAASALLAGAGCTSTSTSTVSTNTNTTTGGVVAFADLKKNMLDASSDGDYNEFQFVDGSGTCVEQGLPKQFSYIKDPTLKYFIVDTEDGSYRNELVSLDFTGNLKYTKVALTGGEATCTTKAVTSNNEATTSCKVNDAEVCTATHTVQAVK
ncbi:MAG: hypothetical protein WCV88_05855 [Patescibacteria group bacterium]|jgi:hypothetical protein